MPFYFMDNAKAAVGRSGVSNPASNAVNAVNKQNELKHNIPTEEKSASEKRIIINVGGQRHETCLSTLERLPGTRLAMLAHLQEADETYDVQRGEYWFDRHPRAFDVILHYHRTEELHVDQSVCGNVLKAEFANQAVDLVLNDVANNSVDTSLSQLHPQKQSIELKFWGIEQMDIEACCWHDYSKYTEHKNTLDDLDETFAFAEVDAWGDQKTPTKLQVWATKIWKFLEDPSSSRVAKLYAVISMFFVALSIGIFVAETHKLFQIDATTGRNMYVLDPEDHTPTSSKLRCCCQSDADNKTANSYRPVTHPALEYLDYICVAFFTIEFFLRLAFAPNKLKFVKQALNIIDFVCLIPHFTSIAIRSLNAAQADSNQAVKDFLQLITFLRIVRILRIFKLMKHYSAFKILAYTIKVSAKELLLMVVFLFSGVLIFAAVIHYAERNNFPNIPIGIWWALVTMTTVGYGDKYPIGVFGYVVGSLSVICGVLVIAFTVPIVVNNFSLYYAHAQTRIKLPNIKRKKKRPKPARAQTPKSLISALSKQSMFSELPMETPRETTGSDKSDTVSRETNASYQNNNLDRSSSAKARLYSAKNKEDKMSNILPGEVDILTINPENKYEAETEQIVKDLKDAENRLQEERQRQQELLQRKRDARKNARLKAAEKVEESSKY